MRQVADFKILTDQMMRPASLVGVLMNIYHIWAELKDGYSPSRFANDLTAYLDYMKSDGRIENWRLMRRKLGLAPAWSTEFHIMIETRDLAQLDQAFLAAAPRKGDVERLHGAVYSAVKSVEFALYRDWPDQLD